MRFINLLCAVIALGTIVSGANASCEIGFEKQFGSSTVLFKCKYDDGYERSSSTSDVSEFAGDINSVSRGAMSVDKVKLEDTLSETNAYSIGDGVSDCDLMVFDTLKKTNNNVKKLVFDGRKFCGQSVSLQFNYDSPEDMDLPKVDCHNIALVKINVENTSENTIGNMLGFNTDVNTGLVYNNRVNIGGKVRNGVNSDIEKGLCIFTNGGIDKMKCYTNGSGRINLGKPYMSEADWKFVQEVRAGKNQYLTKDGEKRQIGKPYAAARNRYAALKEKYGLN